MYDEHFGFSQGPFQAIPDPRFFYSNRFYQEAFTGVRWGIKLRRGLMAMTGEAGTGKTTLIRMVAEKFEDNTRAALITRYPGNFTELLRRLLIDFGFTKIPDDRLKMMEGIRKYATSQFQQERIAAVFLDEAQHIDVAALKQLELLADLETDNNKLLQIVLVGSPELATKLDQPELRSIRERLALWCRIAPLVHSEVRSYIDYQLTQAGYKEPVLFAPGAVEQIARFSKGIPGEINRICRHALLAAYGIGEKYISPEIVHQVVRDLRIIDELGAEAVSDSHLGGLQAGDWVSAPQETPVQNHRPKAGHAHPLPFEADPSGKQNPSRQIQRPKNLGRLNIPTLLTICALAGSPVAFYVFEQGPVLDLNKDHIAGAEQAISDGPGRKAYPNVLAKESAEEQFAIQATAPASKSPIVGEPEPLPIPRVTRVPRTGPFSARVYLHTSRPRDRVVLERVGDALRAGGYTIPATRLTSGRTRGDVRFFFPQDRLTAERIKSLVEAEFAERGYEIVFELLERDGKRFQFAAPGKIEVWVPPLPKS
jgi:general secretion pathway protein A